MKPPKSSAKAPASFASDVASATDWLDSVLAILPDDPDQLLILKTLAAQKHARGRTTVQSLAETTSLSRERGVRALRTMMTEGLVDIDPSGTITLTEFGEKSLLERSGKH